MNEELFSKKCVQSFSYKIQRVDHADHVVQNEMKILLKKLFELKTQMMSLKTSLKTLLPKLN